MWMVGQGGSNPHGSLGTHQIPSLARLPVSALPHGKAAGLMFGKNTSLAALFISASLLDALLDMPLTRTAIYVRCELLPGLFDSEYLVSVLGTSAFVSHSSVRLEHEPQGATPGTGQVLAYLVTKEGGRALIELPGEPVLGGLRSWVPADYVVDA